MRSSRAVAVFVGVVAIVGSGTLVCNTDGAAGGASEDSDAAFLTCLNDACTQRLDALLVRGEIDAVTEAVADSLQRNLSLAELDHLGNTDFATTTPESLLGDAVWQRAFVLAAEHVAALCQPGAALRWELGVAHATECDDAQALASGSLGYVIDHAKAALAIGAVGLGAVASCAAAKAAGAKAAATVCAAAIAAVVVTVLVSTATRANAADSCWLPDAGVAPGLDAGVDGATPGFRTVLDDDFSDPDWQSRWEVGAGTWSIESGRFRAEGAGADVDAWAYSGDAWLDVDYRVRIDFGDGDGTVLVRASGGHLVDAYRIGMFPASYPDSVYANRYGLVRYRDGVAEGLVNLELAPFAIPDSMDLRVMAVEGTIEVYVDDTPLFDFTDPAPLPAGRIGLGVAWDRYAYFDEVLVQTSDPE